MKHLFLVGIFSSVLSFAIAQDAALKKGDKAPGFSLPDSSGVIVNLADFKGRYVVLEFWGSWCPYCRKEIPRLKEFNNDHKNSVVMIGIAHRDKKEPWKKIIAANNMEWINLFNEDPALIKAYGIRVYPSKIIVGPDGNIAELLPGAAEDVFPRLENFVGSIKSKQ